MPELSGTMIQGLHYLGFVSAVSYGNPFLVHYWCSEVRICFKLMHFCSHLSWSHLNLEPLMHLSNLCATSLMVCWVY